MDTPDRDQLSTVKRALLELREMRARLEQAQRARTEPIAIVGLSCRFPGAPDPDAFWALLREGGDAITEVPADRWPLAQWFDADPDAPGKMATRHGGFLASVDRFDAAFFGITPREAERLDPQQRLLLEVAWEALERAAIPADRLAGDQIGVFVGLSNSDYFQLQLQHGDTADIDAYMASGSSPAVAAGRIAFTLGLQGPAITVDTACSSSLSAVHLACQSLRDGECTAALAGGVSLILVPELTVNFSKARMMAPDGRCKTFDARADGYVRSEGCGIVVLKRLSDAQAEGDHILAVVCGSAVNQDGRSSGLTVPNGPAQEAVVREALRRSGLEPADVDYVEAHGTGTALGDPIELRALGAVFADRPAGRPLAVGSVKTNVGHLEAAAGVAGLIKVVLSIQHGEIPRHLHFESPTPHVDWQALPLAVPVQAQQWPLRDGRRVGGVSSFGFSGTNAHVVVMSPPATATGETGPADRLPLVLPLSAKTPAALRNAAARLADWLSASPGADLGAVCDTAGHGRAHFPHRLAVVVDSAAGLSESLRAYSQGRPSGAVTASSASVMAPEVAFLFTGQGSQYLGMGRTLYERSPVFRAALDRCDEVLRPVLPHPLLDVLFDRHGRGILLDETAWTQPALFALEYALSELWRGWGVRPSVVLGHSLGEDVAACVAGMVGLEDGLRLVAERGRLMQALPKSGAMRAVFAGVDRVSSLVQALGADVSVAAINGPEHTTVSGTIEAIAALEGLLARQGIRTRPIAASHAFHSRLMDPALDAYEAAASRVAFQRPEVTIVSNVTGQVGGEEMRTPRYWRRHVREAVRFSDSVETAWGLGVRLFVEIGPGASLVGLGERCVSGDAAWVPSLRRDRDEWREVLTSLSILYSRGVSVDWSAMSRSPRRQVAAIPTYPFQRERHWTRLPGALRTHESAAPADVDRQWAQVAGAVARQAELVPIDLALGTYEEKWQRLDHLALEFIAAAFAGMGVFHTAGDTLDAAQLRDRLGVQPSYVGLVTRWLDVLVRHGRLVCESGRFVATRPFDDAGQVSAREARASRELFADYPSLLEYFTRCATRLSDIVTGRESALETLFPGGATTLADQLYGLSAMARYFNNMVRAAVEAAAAASTPSRPLRILEIGGGTGGTTRGLLPALQADRTDYCFTDVGPLFLSRARETFSAHRFVRYQLLDIERPPAEQGFASHSFDLVVASNVLHATRNLRETLANVASLLSPSGALVMYEATAHPPWFDVTTALISGWQRFDDDIRVDVPLVAPERWALALADAGFVETQAFPGAASPAAVMGQHVIVSRGPLTVSGRADGARADDTALPADDRSRGAAAGGDVSAEDATRLHAELMVLPALNRRERLVAFVREHVVAVLRLDPSQPPDRQQRLMDLGVDSLMAVELRNRLVRGLGLERKLPATLIFDYPTVDAIADLLAGSIGAPDHRGPGAVAAPADAPADTSVAATAALIQDLDDEAVEALLTARLEDLEERHGRR